MGSDNYYERERIRIQQELHELQLQREYKEQTRRFEEALERQRIENERRNKMRLAQAQRELDIQSISYILKFQGYLGYNLNPYKMSSSELKYWNEKITKELMDALNLK